MIIISFVNVSSYRSSVWGRVNFKKFSGWFTVVYFLPFVMKYVYTSHSFLFKELLPKLDSLGCFVEKKRKLRLLNIKFGSFASSYQASDPHATVVKCAHLARDMNYEYFAVQNLGDCWADTKIVENFDKYGNAPPEKCVGGVGASYTNFVYRWKPEPSV